MRSLAALLTSLAALSCGAPAADMAPAPSVATAAVPALCGAGGLIDNASFRMRFAHPPSPTAATDVSVQSSADMIRYSHEHRDDSGRRTTQSEVVCHGAGLALRAHTEGGRRHEFEPPLTIAVLGDAEGAAEGVVTIVDSVSSTTVPYAHAWSSQLVDASEPALPGIEARWGIEMRSVLYVGDAHEPAQQTRTRWLIGDGIAVVAERIALLDDDEVRDEAVSLERD